MENPKRLVSLVSESRKADQIVSRLQMKAYMQPSGIHCSVFRTATTVCYNSSWRNHGESGGDC
jgi:hypothetical protein